MFKIYTLVFKKVDVSEIYMSFVFSKQKKKQKMYIYFRYVNLF